MEFQEKLLSYQNLNRWEPLQHRIVSSIGTQVRISGHGKRKFRQWGLGAFHLQLPGFVIIVLAGRGPAEKRPGFRVAEAVALAVLRAVQQRHGRAEPRVLVHIYKSFYVFLGLCFSEQIFRALYE